MGGDRVSVEFTYYNKETKDALILKPVIPSAGQVVSQFFETSPRSVDNHGGSTLARSAAGCWIAHST